MIREHRFQYGALARQWKENSFCLYGVVMSTQNQGAIQPVDDYIGAQLARDKAVGLFPDTWLAFKNVQYDRATFLGGTYC